FTVQYLALMKNLTALFLFSILVATTSAQTGPAKPAPKTTDNGYLVNAVIKPYKNCWMYLGSYYGKSKILVDSAYFNDKSEGIFKGATKLPKGIYFFVTPAHSLLFEILMDDKQHFNVVADSAHLKTLAVTGSPDNDIFAAYS